MLRFLWVLLLYSASCVTQISNKRQEVEVKGVSCATDELINGPTVIPLFSSDNKSSDII